MKPSHKGLRSGPVLLPKVREGCLSSKANYIYGSPTNDSLASVMFVGVLVSVFVGLSS